MWKYVSRRVKDTIELGINARKAFSINYVNQNEKESKQPKNEGNTFKSLILSQQDPSSKDKDKRDEKFKRKYHRLHHNQRCFLNALTWSAALVSGFYASQLLCLYRRNHRLNVDGQRCFYSKYLISTTQSVHRNIQYLLTPTGQNSLIESVTKFASSCPLKKVRAQKTDVPVVVKVQRSSEDEFKDFQNFIDPEYKRFEQFFESLNKNRESKIPHNVTNDKSHTSEYKTKDTEVKKQKSQDQAIDEAIQQLAKIVGEIEFQLGVQSYHAKNYEDAVEHFKLCTTHSHPKGIFNLALCYERGLGVKKNLKTAKKLYKIASGLGHAKAMYNLGVFHAQGLGGADKNFEAAKKCFEEAAKMGNAEAIDAINLLLPKKQKFMPLIDEYEELLWNHQNTNKLGAIENVNLMRIAVT